MQKNWFVQSGQAAMECLRGVLKRVPRFPRRRPRSKTKPRLSGLVRSLGGFLFGLFLASVYGMTALFVQNQGLWYCVCTTIAIAFLTAFGMGLSIRVRANVMLMMPMLCSMKGKNFLLFLIFSMLVQGPMTNTLENFDRAADSVVCGAELAMNQTQQLMERAATPLLSVLGKIKEITKNVHSVAGRVQNLIQALTESVRHVARSLRNVLHFLVGIGEVCNDKLGTPYKKCNKLFDDARDDCMELLSVFNFLCHIVDGFRPLCGLARVGQLFCIIPSYIVGHMKTKIAAPTIAAFEKMKKEFEFNISASMHFDMNVNSSQSLQQVSQDMMEEVSVELGRFQEVMGLIAYIGLFLLLLMYLQAVLYKHKYLHQDDFDNTYITEQFEELDQRLASEGKTPVLPLSQKEARTYIRPFSVYLTARERQTAALSAVSILRHIAMGCLVVALDLVVFWMFDLVHHQAQGDIVARAPIVVAVEVNGTGYASDIFKDIVAAFAILQKGNITVLSKKCLMEPSEPDHSGYMLIGFLYGLTLFIVFAGSYVKRLRRLVCARYHPKRERKRVHLLHRRIQSQRKSLGKALLRSVARSRADGEGTRFLQTLTTCLPGGSYLAEILGVSSVSCMACGRRGEGQSDPSMVTCITPQCKGVYCKQCFQSMGQVCAVCMGPLTFQEDCEEELGTRRLMKRRISMATRRRPSESRVQRGAYSSIGLVEGDSGDSSGHISPPSDSEHSEPDMIYQDYSEQDHSEPSDDDYNHNPNPALSLSAIYVSGGLETQGCESDTSDSDASFHSVTSGRIDHSQYGSLRTVTVHSLDHNSQ
ncbi:DC-STAMP domain-containing protein 2 isoform X3 [Oncorhynchus keta]|uniref:DC-STAMP domain-containing protein 2 isoform X3 n=1 Tax=Oncorhynchus keta TaxID=8018 RepID=UPI00227B82E8|nr:DC-STAMP domain-containing protein 2 isoform X3 [Oncorhynchus keta]